jgi:hypothetical protein
MISQNHMQKIKKILISASIVLMVVVPGISLAQGAPDSGLVHCGITDKAVLAAHKDYANPCDFNSLMDLVNTVINFILFKMVVPIAAIMFAYAGYLLVTAGGETAGARTKAKSIFTNAIVGLIIAVAAWLIVSTILAILGYNGTWIGLKIGL